MLDGEQKSMDIFKHDQEYGVTYRDDDFVLVTTSVSHNQTLYPKPNHSYQHQEDVYHTDQFPLCQ